MPFDGLPQNYHIAPLKPGDTALATQLAAWYFQEWNIAPELYLPRLIALDPTDVEIQLVLFHHDKPIASGGIHHKVGLLHIAPEYTILDPWLAVLYTLPEYRKQGLGSILLLALEQAAANCGYSKLYLYTHTAENLYSREGWSHIQKPSHLISYKGKRAVVMEKSIPTNQ